MDKAGYLRRVQTHIIDRMAPSLVMEKDSLLYWRVHILFAIISTAMALSLFVLVPVIFFTIKNRFWGLLGFDLLSWSVGLYLLISKRLRYEARASVSLFMFYAVGLYIIVYVGPMSGGPAWLFAFAVMVGILLGERAAVAALTLNALTLAAIGWLMATGKLGQGPPLFGSTAAMLVAGINFIFLNAIAAISVAMLVKGLVSTHRKEKQLTETLEKERSQLITATHELESQVEERKRAEKAARHSEKKYRNLVENVNDVIYSLDADGRIAYISPAVTRFTGYDPAELIGRHFSEFIYADDVKSLVERFPGVLAGEKGPEEYRILTKTGERRWIRSSSQPIRIQGEPGGLQGVLTDITGQKSLKAQLQLAHKMEAIGTLSGGIAHEFNNILAIIIGNVELAMGDAPNLSPRCEFLSEARIAGLRGKKVVRQLLSFSRQTGQEHQALDIGSVVKESLGYLRVSIPTTVKFEVLVSAPGFAIMGNPTQIHQVMINLCTNAAHAMEENGGTVKVSLRGVTLQDAAIFFDTRLMAGDYVCLRVEDSGHGIPADRVDRIFDPFFTTKEIDKGSGMGLAVVLGIVKEHGGGIRVASRTGAGSSFECYFPLVEGVRLEAPEEVQPIRGGSETILLVDDEASLVKMGRLRLERLGYRVQERCNPRQALEDFRANPDQFDLLITDMTMPEMTGDQLIHEIVGLRPDMKTIICSGWSQKMDGEKAADMGASAFLPKPVEGETLARTVRDVLDGRAKR